MEKNELILPKSPIAICTITTKREDYWRFCRTLPSHITYNAIFDMGLRAVCEAEGLEYPGAK